ncbi:hypothetical protein EsH8_I_000819 [Colletotrichum jinshuiense]
MAWSYTLQCYDDGLGAIREPGQVLRFSSLSEKPEVMEKLKEHLRMKKTSGTADLPRETEKASGDDEKLEGLWVGWFLPLEESLEWDEKLKGCSVKMLVNGGASNSVHRLGQQDTALKVICRMRTESKDMKYYALAYPDSQTGICHAIFLGSGRQVFFHREYRDDEMTRSHSRERGWTTLI